MSLSPLSKLQIVTADLIWDSCLHCLIIITFFSALNVACDVHLLTITISKSSLGPAVKQLYVGQRIEGCTFDVDPSTETTFSIHVDTCGTKRWTRGNYLFYNNIVYGKAESDGDSPVVYSEDVTFNATCVFNRNVNVTAAFLPNANFTVDVTGNESANL